MATTQQEMTKALVKAVTRELAKTNGNRHPAKQHNKQVQKYVKGHAGKNGQHHSRCSPHITPHCRAIITAGPRRGQECGLCLTLYAGWRGWTDVFLGPVCSKHFHADMRRKAAARRRGY